MATRPQTDGDHIRELYHRIYAVVRRIPRGRVATYGQVAELAGLPRGARVAGAAMRASGPGHRLPWHRVLGKKARGTAKIAILDPVGAGIQQAMLEKEGVTFTPSGGIRLADFGWLPEDPAPRQRTKPRARRK
ncbi:MAG TPA: MGMT family protein [Kofleriaceae bacterium]|nr:MGMT family protein [Kofleriaceae bacterium]